MAPHEDDVSELVKRIVDTVQPLRVILFGSAARGSVRPDSDVDLLIVMPEGTHRRRTAQHLYRMLAGAGGRSVVYPPDPSRDPGRSGTDGLCRDGALPDRA